MWTVDDGNASPEDRGAEEMESFDTATTELETMEEEARMTWQGRVTDTVLAWEGKYPGYAISIFAAACSFSSYFLAYGFRKPWTASTWQGVEAGTLFGFKDTKLFLDWSQILGYTLGKFLGIFLVPSLYPSLRFPFLLLMPVLSSLIWFVFGANHATPLSLFLCFFFSAMPLSIIWSLLYLYLEGRNNPDFLGAVLSSSIIIGSSVAKALGRGMLSLGVSQYWMPFVCALIYLPPYLVLVFLTASLPEPSIDEIRKMNIRRPMTQEEKAGFLKKHFVGLASMTLAYMLLTSARDFRDTFTVDIFEYLGDSPNSISFLVFLIDIPVGLVVCALLILLTFVANNKLNVMFQHMAMLTGYGLILTSQILFSGGLISEYFWYFGCGVGVYLAYTPVGAMFYDRIGGALPWEESAGTATFMIQVSDFCGYLGTITLYTLQGLGLLGFHGNGGEGSEDMESLGGAEGMMYYDILSSFYIVVGVFGLCGVYLSGRYWWRTLHFER